MMGWVGWNATRRGVSNCPPAVPHLDRWPPEGFGRVPPVRKTFAALRFASMWHDLTKGEKRALRTAAQLAHGRDRTMAREDRDVHYLEARNYDLPLVVGAAVAQGLLTIEEVGEVARERVAHVAGALQAIRESSPIPISSEEDEDEGYDAEAPVSVAAIVREIDSLRDETTLYVNRRTGEVRVMDHEYLPDDDIEDDVEDDDDPGEPAWLADAKEEGREVVSSPDWIALLDPFDIHEQEIMRRFARNARPAASRDLLDALNGRGAYRRFREEIHRRGLQKEWDAFREDRLADRVRFALQEHEIAYRK
jgi:hypothetical protein